MFPGRSAARSGALQTRDRKNTSEFGTIPNQRCTANALHRIWETVEEMAEVHFTSHLRNLVPAGPFAAPGATVGEALQALFAAEPQARLYVLDERGALRKHVCIFADGERLANDAALSRRIDPATKLYVMQALSGG